MKEEIKISMGKNATDTTLKTTSLENALKRIRNGASKPLVEHIRKLKAQGSTADKERSEAKLKSVYVIFQGQFSKRKKEGLIQHSGLATLDFDKVHEPKFYRDTFFKQNDFVLASWVSPSGDGVKAIVRIPEVNDDAEYKSYYNALIKYVDNDGIDEVTKDISRICFESYDPDIRIREWDKTSVFEEQETTSITPEAEIATTEHSHHFYNTARAKLDDAKLTNQKHSALLRLSRLAGGYVKSGELKEAQVKQFLFDEVKQRGAVSMVTAQRTIAEGIAEGKHIPVTTKAPKKLSQKQIEELKVELRVDPLEKVERPPAVIYIVENEEKRIFSSLGSVCMITGKAKSRKTFALTAAVAAALSGEVVLDKFMGNLPPDKSQVLYFGTEQSNYHAHKTAQRVIRMASESCADNLQFYKLHRISTRERLQFIDSLVGESTNVGLVIIDGVRDLLFDINSQEEATKVWDYIAKWTADDKLHVMVVLHENKNSKDKLGRGHIGSELNNKAETVVSVSVAEQSDKISVVTAEFTRNRPFDGFSFTIDDSGLPVPSDAPAVPSSRNIKPHDFDYNDHIEFAKAVFQFHDEYTSGDMVFQVKHILGLRDYSIGKDKAREFIILWEAQGIIKNMGSSNRKKYVLMKK